MDIAPLLSARMGKKDFTQQYAKQTRSTPAEAADQVDRIINGLLRRLRAGKSASLPGFGILQPREQSEGDFEHSRKAKAPKDAL